MTISLALGSRLPAYPTSMGRVLLAGLTDAQIDEYIAQTSLEQLTENTVTDPARFRSILMKVRAQGYALVDQELEEGVRSLAAPILNARGEVMAAMNVSCHATRATVARMRDEFLPHLLATAAEVSDRASALRVG
jgi:IclR family pca regulon transcriptional regulator